MLKAAVWLALFVISQARIIEENCNGVIINNINHEKEILKAGIESPYQLAIDYDTNTLFFSFSNHEGNEVFKSAYLNLKTNEYGTISGITGGFANAVDSRNHIVYLGGNDGIYKFDFNTKRANYVFTKGSNIWQMFYKDKLYYTVYPDETVYVYENQIFKKLRELDLIKATNVGVDKNDNIFFSNSSGLFRYEKTKGNILNMGEYDVNGITADINENLYFSTPTGIYSIDESGETIEHIATIPTVYGLVIEGDNHIIYSSQDSIIRLKPTETVCFSDEKKIVETV